MLGGTLAPYGTLAPNSATYHQRINAMDDNVIELWSNVFRYLYLYMLPCNEYINAPIKSNKMLSALFCSMFVKGRDTFS